MFKSVKKGLFGNKNSVVLQDEATKHAEAAVNAGKQALNDGYDAAVNTAYVGGQAAYGAVLGGGSALTPTHGNLGLGIATAKTSTDAVSTWAIYNATGVVFTKISLVVVAVSVAAGAVLAIIAEPKYLIKAIEKSLGVVGDVYEVVTETTKAVSGEIKVAISLALDAGIAAEDAINGSVLHDYEHHHVSTNGDILEASITV